MLIKHFLNILVQALGLVLGHVITSVPDKLCTYIPKCPVISTLYFIFYSLANLCIQPS